MRVTIKQIAIEAGVSRGAVDKVIHNRPGISDEVRKRIQETIKRLGYTPNKAARALLSSRHETIFAVVMPELDNTFFASVQKGMKKAVKTLGLDEYGIKLEFYYYDVLCKEKLIAILDYLKNRNIQGLIIRGIQNDELEQSLMELREKNIPIVTYDSDIPNIDRLCFIGEDNLKSGRIAASLMVKSINKHGSIAVFLGSDSVIAHKRRVQGFKEYIKENTSNVNIVGVFQTHEQNFITKSLIESVLNSYPDLNGIYNAAGCSDIIADEVKKTNRDIRLITYNFSPEIVKYVKCKTIDFTIGLSPFKQGFLSVQILFNYVLFNEKPDNDVMHIQVSIGIDENIDVFLKQDMLDAL